MQKKYDKPEKETSAPEWRQAVKRARELEKANMHQDALSIYSSYLKKKPKNYRLLMGAGRTAARLGDVEAGLKYFRRASQIAPGKADPIIQIGKIAGHVNLNHAIEVYKDGLTRPGNDGKVKDSILASRITMGEASEFVKTFDFTIEIKRARYSRSVFSAILRARKAELPPEELVKYFGLMCDAFKSDHLLYRYAALLIQVGWFSKAIQAYDRLPNQADKRVLIGKAICYSAQGQNQKCSHNYMEQCLNADVTEYEAITASAKFVGESADIQRAIDIIQDINTELRLDGVKNVIDFCKDLIPPERPLLVGSIRDDAFRISEPGKSRAIVFVFTGYGQRTGPVPFALIDRFFAGHGVAVATFLDAHNCLFWKGVPALGGNFNDTISHMRKLTDTMGIEKVYTLGTSGGGFAAMAYGCELRAKRAVSFSGPTDLRKEFLDTHGDTRGQSIIHSLQKRLDNTQLNLRSWLEACEHRCPIHAYYCEQERRDVVQANNISHLDQVFLHPVPQYASHDSIGTALGSGILKSAFNSIIEEIDND